MYVYEHKQVSRWMLYAVSLPFALAAGATFRRGMVLPALGLAACGGLVALGFSSLTVKVSPSAIVLQFGLGVFTKRFAVEDIHAVRAVRTTWWQGWGIHWTGDGWLYNVGGFDAVELHMAGDRKVRIGTDEPERLVAAIQQVLATRG